MMCVGIIQKVKVLENMKKEDATRSFREEEEL
jgi:hypothetical protein